MMELLLEFAWAFLGILNNITLIICLYGFGYIVPILSSVKAVIHQDVDAHHQWITYWIILTFFHTIEPFLDVALHKWLKVFILAWLSLPRYQGAHFIYHKLIVPKLDKYETTVDGHIDGIRNEAKQRAWSYMMGKGWGLIQQVMLVGRLAKDGDLFGTATTETVQNENNSTKILNSKQQPLHSLNMSDTKEEDERYISDFLNMLSRGLFVFASVQGANVESSTKSEELKLRVFAFDNDQSAFVLSPLEKQGDAYILHPNKIQEIVECTATQGVVITYKELILNIVLSNADDRDTLLYGLNESLSILRSDKLSKVDEI